MRAELRMVESLRVQAEERAANSVAEAQRDAEDLRIATGKLGAMDASELDLLRKNSSRRSRSKARILDATGRPVAESASGRQRWPAQVVLRIPQSVAAAVESGDWSASGSRWRSTSCGTVASSSIARRLSSMCSRRDGRRFAS